MKTVADLTPGDLIPWDNPPEGPRYALVEANEVWDTFTGDRELTLCVLGTRGPFKQVVRGDLPVNVPLHSTI